MVGWIFIAPIGHWLGASIQPSGYFGLTPTNRIITAIVLSVSSWIIFFVLGSEFPRRYHEKVTSKCIIAIRVSLGVTAVGATIVAFDPWRIGVVNNLHLVGCLMIIVGLIALPIIAYILIDELTRPVRKYEMHYGVNEVIIRENPRYQFTHEISRIGTKVPFEVIFFGALTLGAAIVDVFMLMAYAKIFWSHIYWLESVSLSFGLMSVAAIAVARPKAKI